MWLDVILKMNFILSHLSIVEKFLSSQKTIFDQARAVIRKMINDDESVEDENTDLSNEYTIIKTNLQSLAEQTWHDLMHSEIRLFECIEGANSNFKQVIDALLNEFIEYAQGIFVQMRNSEINFSGALHETVARFITMKAVVAEEHTVASELQEVSYLSFIKKKNEDHEIPEWMEFEISI